MEFGAKSGWLSPMCLFTGNSACICATQMESGRLRRGDRLPPTRELALKLGLNRTTVSAAYDVLESEGLIRGEVGRGSFVTGIPLASAESMNWSRALVGSVSTGAGMPLRGGINFSSSRPSEKLFPIEEFRESCREVLESRSLKTLMQLGSPGGYEPLRRYLLERATASGMARESDDILITNGCQQALDLLRRALVRAGDKVAVEEPVYPGLKNLFLEGGAELIGVSAHADGIDLHSLQRALDAKAKVLVVTPSFQNPTGATISAAARAEICRMARRADAAVIENDIYSELSYSQADAGSMLPRLKELDANVILLGSFSKIAFPGMRVGWIIGPTPCDRARDGTEAARGSAHGPSLAGVSAAVRGIGPAGAASECGDRRGEGKAARAGAILPQIFEWLYVSGAPRRHEYVDHIAR